MLDLVVKNARITNAWGVTEGDLMVDKGKIVGVALRGGAVEAKRVVDAEGRHVVPGAIDSHSHVGQMPGDNQVHLQTQEENFETESASALYGGVTTAANYIFTQESLDKVFDRFRKMANENSCVDIKYHGALMNQAQLDKVDEYVKMGMNSFKIFMPYKGEEARNLGGLGSLDDGQIIEAFIKLKRLGALPVVHAENPDLVQYYTKKNMDPTRQDMEAYEQTRPGICEGEAASKILYFAKQVGIKVGIAHVSSKEAVEAILSASGQRVIMETCAHYMLLTTDSGLGSLGKVCPPVRYQADREAIWEAVARHDEVMVGSDHNAWVKAHKQDLWEGLAGLCGNSVILPALFSEGVGRRGFSTSDIVRISSYTAARAFGLYPRKGAIVPGSDADLVIMDTGISKKLDPAETGSISDYTPYRDFEFTAWPHTVIVGGEVAVVDGQWENKAHRGSCLN